MSQEKRATLTHKNVEHGYSKYTMTYEPSGKTFTRYLAPENRNQDHDLRNEMSQWAEARGYTVYWNLGGTVGE